MVNDKHGKTKIKKRVQSMAEMDTVESEVNDEGDILASAGANASKNDEMDEDNKVKLRAKKETVHILLCEALR